MGSFSLIELGTKTRTRNRQTTSLEIEQTRSRQTNGFELELEVHKKLITAIKVHSAKFYFHKPITVQLELYLFYCFIHYLLYIGQY